MSKKGKRRFRKPSLRTRAAIYALFTASAVLCAVSYKQWQDGQRRYWEQMQHVEAMKLNKSLSGNYLAARFAVAVDDLRSASHYYDRSLEYTKDKDFIIQRALPAAIGAGDIKEALRLSQGMDLKQPSLNAQLGVMVQLIDAFKRSDAAKVAELLPLMREEGFGRLLSPLIMTWSEALKQKPAEAVARLDQMEKEYPTVKPLINAQKAVVYEVQKKNDLAEKYFLKSLEDNLSLRSAWMIGQFYERQGNKEKALAVYQKLTEKISDSPYPQLAVQRVRNGGMKTDAAALTVADGVSSALYDVASVLYQESSPRMAVLYVQLAYYLTPQDPFVNLLLGDIFATSMMRDSAIDYYMAVTKQADMAVLARMRLVSLYESSGQIDRALNMLEDLRTNPVTQRQAVSEIADIYRRQEKYAKAIPYYDEIIARIKTPKESDWPVYYARAICLERENKLEESEKDLKQALALSPDQPEVLNYLAYTWVDHDKNLEKALDMLLRALAGSPQDPYITDSVGWTLYRLGRYEQAISYLDTAVQGLPDDTTVNDHLGDAYWRVGRRLEAGYQWKRAFKSAGPNEADLKKSIEDKLLHGLPESSLTGKQSKVTNG